MAEQKTRGDSLALYRTGANTDGGSVEDPNDSLGDYRAAEVETPTLSPDELAYSLGSGSIVVIRVADANGTGTGVLAASAVDALKWTPPGGAQGAAVTIANGETKLIEGNDPDQYIVVERGNANDLTGSANVVIAETSSTLNPLVLPFNALTSAELAAGTETYRCLAVKNWSAASVTVVKAMLATLGTQATSDVADLDASGAGTIETTDSFADWPTSGWALIRESDGTEREIVYYSSRTDTVLTVPATGRGLRGTSAAAGAATDLIDSIPSIDIGIEAPDAQPDGTFATIADEDTAPAAITFSAPIVDADALSIGTLTTGQIHGIWLRQMTPADMVSDVQHLNRIRLTFDTA